MWVVRRRRPLRLLLVPCAAALLVLACHVLAVPVAGAVFRPPRSAATPADLGLSYRERVFRGAGRQRLPAWVVPSGAPRGTRGTVLILAENGADRTHPRMLWLASVVSARGWDALLVDLRGHGVSGGVNTYGPGETRDLLAVLEALGAEAPDRSVVAVGFSLGASCLRRALSTSEVLAGALVFAPYARLDASLIRDELRYQSTGRPGAALAARLVWARLIHLSLLLWAGFPALPEPEELVTTRPVHLFHARGDPEIPYRNALDILERARAPSLVLHTVERASHLPPLEDTEVWGEVASTLAQLLD